ncbi:Diphthamide biosynthesis protein 4 [Mortierella alpina]|uniref:Diphthamide biosynthesis protein 4 n=1 Tax=Mortierella alpina TaxID=64518 RepID=A0A9P6JBW8_MORAP|nr:Diphthamide biosynthesis protein 4 [Mortierella alpina]
MLKDYYAILSVSQDASLSEIKLQYQKLLLIHHPDKQQQNQSVLKEAIPLQDIKEAWECLRQPSQRAFYDSSLKALRLRANGQVNDDIDLDDMDYNEDSGAYSAPCRCSGEYVISEEELELGVDTVVCSTCSLIVRIHYEVETDRDDDNDSDGNNK